MIAMSGSKLFFSSHYQTHNLTLSISYNKSGFVDAENSNIMFDYFTTTCMHIFSMVTNLLDGRVILLQCTWRKNACLVYSVIKEWKRKQTRHKHYPQECSICIGVAHNQVMSLFG